MSSGMIFKNPEKPKNHKPAIAAGIVVGYNFLKDRKEKSTTETSHTSGSSKGANIAGRSIMVAILSPVIGAIIGLFTNAEIGFISIPVILGLCLISFIYALIAKE